MIDSNIPLQYRGFDAGQAADRVLGMKARSEAMQMQREGHDLARERMAMDQQKFMAELSAEQRKQAQEQLEQLATDGRWAMGDPNKWRFVQEKWKRQGVDLTQYGVNDIERGLMELGQLQTYLDNAPKSQFIALEPGATLAVGSPESGDVRMAVLPNDGSHQVGAPVGGNIPPAAVQELMADPSPEAIREFDEHFGPGSAAKAMGGSGGNVGGGFPR